MLKVAVIASGRAYQKAAAWAASTFAVFLTHPSRVSVMLPANERIDPFLAKKADQFHFHLERFPFKTRSRKHFTTPLKCQAFEWQVANLKLKEIVLFADADTACLRPIRLPSRLRTGILAGKVGVAADIVDRHFTDPDAPWYLTPTERSVYVNSGVILASRRSLPFFRRVRQLSSEQRFLTGPFHDQKVINFAIGKYFHRKLLVLKKEFNSIGEVSEKTVIAHFAGGAGLLDRHPREANHRRLCAAVLRQFAASACDQ